MHHFFENNWVNILAEHVQQKPVTHLGLLYDDINALFLDESEPNEQQVSSHSRREYDEHSVDADHEGKAEQEDQPEPQEDVDFLVDNVEGKDTHRVMFLDFP